MKYEIYQSTEAKDEKRIRLMLVEDTEGTVDLCVVDEDGGVDSYLVGLTPAGMLIRYASVDRDFGFAHSADGKIREEGDE